MKFVEEAEGTFSAAQLAAAERELEQQKKEWELDRLRALREEEERRMRMADDDEKPLTFSREDAQNQVNNTSNSKRVGSRKRPVVQASRRSSRRLSVRESSDSETETTTESESESQEDLVEESPDEESSHNESQSQDDDGEGNDSQHESENGGQYSKRGKHRSKAKFNRKNHLDLNSPRTRSRGNVKINLWTLDVSPILPVTKRHFKNHHWRKQKRGDNFAHPQSPISKQSSSEYDPERTDSVISSPQSYTRKSLVDSQVSDNYTESANETGDNIGENESELTSSMDMSSCPSDDSDDNETDMEFSPKIKTDNSCKSSEKILYLDSVKSTDSSMEKDDDNIPTETIRRSRGRRRGSHVKKLTQTFDGVFNETEIKLETESIVALTHSTKATSPVHVTRSMQKLSSQFNKTPLDNSHNEDAENHDVNVGSPNNKYPVASSPTTDNESPLDREYYIIPKCETKVKADDESAEDSPCTDVNPDPETESAVYRTRRTCSRLKNNISLKIRTRQSSKSQPKSQSDDSAGETIMASEEPIINEDNEKSLVDNDELIEENLTTDETSKDISIPTNSTDTLDTKLEALPVLTDDKTTETFATPNLLIKTTLDTKKRLRRPDTPLPQIMTRRSKASMPITESPLQLANDVEPKKNVRRPRTPIMEQRRVTRFSGTVSTDSLDSQESEHPADKDLQEVKVVLESMKIKKAGSSRSSSPVPSNTNIAKTMSRVTRSTTVESTDKPATRRSKGPVDNGFVLPVQLNRKLKINSSPKPIDTKKLNDNIVGDFPISQKRRPDTPMPTNLTRVTRSGIEFKSPTNQSRNKNIRKTLITTESNLDLTTTINAELTDKKDPLNTDTNGNAVELETLSNRIAREPSPVFFEVNERPQRTAKVVAMITLDTHSRNNHKTSSINSSKKLHEDNVKKDINCDVTTTTDDAKIRSRSNSKSNTPSRLSSPVDTTIDNGSDSENDATDTTRRLRKTAKRSRKLSKIKNTDVQLVDNLDNEDNQLGPTKKLIKLQTTGTSEKINSQAS